MNRAIVLGCLAVTSLCACGGSLLMRSAKGDLAAGNPGRALGTLDMELRRDGSHGEADALRREAAAQWARSELSKARADGPRRLFAVANHLSSELTRRQLGDVAQAEVTPALTEGLAGIWAELVESKVTAGEVEVAVV